MNCEHRVLRIVGVLQGPDVAEPQKRCRHSDSGV